MACDEIIVTGGIYFNLRLVYLLENRWFSCETQKVPDYFLESADEIDKDAAVKTNCSHMVDAYINGGVELKLLAKPEKQSHGATSSSKAENHSRKIR